MSYRPEINLRLSKWEIFLAFFVPVIFSVGFIYAIINWKNIPDIIYFNRSNKIREMNKMSSWLIYSLGSLTITAFGYFYILCVSRSKYYGGRSVSSNLCKNILQYRIETSCLLCELILISIWYLIAAIAPIEIQIGHINSSQSWLYPILISIPIVWLIHHLLWTRLSDK
jgi:hypothetical protein